MSKRLLPTFFLAFAAASVGAQAPPVADSIAARASALFAHFSGRWSCVGGFARGGSLQADLTFSSVADGRALMFVHADRPPNTYWQSASWSLDDAGRIVSLAVAGSTKSRTGTPSLFIATAWNENSLTLVADTVKSPPFAPNQFTYSLTTGNDLKMVWEVSRNGSRAVGDSLLCHRAG